MNTLERLFFTILVAAGHMLFLLIVKVSWEEFDFFVVHTHHQGHSKTTTTCVLADALQEHSRCSDLICHSNDRWQFTYSIKLFANSINLNIILNYETFDLLQSIHILVQSVSLGSITQIEFTYQVFSNLTCRLYIEHGFINWFIYRVHDLGNYKIIICFPLFKVCWIINSL